jgi:hypothetical protein
MVWWGSFKFCNCTETYVSLAPVIIFKPTRGTCDCSNDPKVTCESDNVLRVTYLQPPGHEITIFFTITHPHTGFLLAWEFGLGKKTIHSSIVIEESTKSTLPFEGLKHLEHFRRISFASMGWSAKIVFCTCGELVKPQRFYYDSLFIK